MKKKIIILAVLLIAFSCKKEEPQPDICQCRDITYRTFGQQGAVVSEGVPTGRFCYLNGTIKDTWTTTDPVTMHQFKYRIEVVCE